MRSAEIKRNTSETKIALSLCLDGKGISHVNSGCGFLDHMLTLFARHGRFDLSLICQGDTQVDYHHSVEDIAICLGQAFSEALCDKRGIQRYGDSLLPMDEALIQSAVDISGRAHLSYALLLPSQKLGDFDTELVEEFWTAFVRECGCTLHINQISGRNTHHIIEAAFKSVARSMKAAVAIDEAYSDEIPSTKGLL